MPATYDRSGIKFLYPDNWVLSDQGDTELPRAISLEEPDGAMWSAHLYPAEYDPDLLVKDTVVALEETYPDLEITPTAKDFDHHDGTAVDAIFFCLDFLVRVKLQTIQTEGFQVLLWYQAEDREFEKHEPVFHAVSTSMLQSLV